MNRGKDGEGGGKRRGIGREKGERWGERERKEMGEVQSLDSPTLLGRANWRHNFCANLRYKVQLLHQ